MFNDLDYVIIDSLNLITDQKTYLEKMAVFQHDLKTYFMAYCHHCKERWFDHERGISPDVSVSVNLCKQCRSNRLRHREKFDWKNDTDPLRPAPDPASEIDGFSDIIQGSDELRQLPGMSAIEEMLIARCIPAFSVFRPRQCNGMCHYWQSCWALRRRRSGLLFYKIGTSPLKISSTVTAGSRPFCPAATAPPPCRLFTS